MSMIQTNFEKVKQWHEVFAPHFASRTGPTLEIPETTHDLRIGLIDEELDELKEALELNDIVEVADALCDLLYVVYGAGVTYGLPMDELFAEVHRSNMSKLGDDGKPVVREDGKVLKGPNFSLPNLEMILKKGPTDGSV